jgi:hypothetical protein
LQQLSHILKPTKFWLLMIAVLMILLKLLAPSRGVTVIRHLQRRGQTAAWHTALSHAEHNVVVFCDADAQPEPGAIQKLAHAIATGADLAGGLALPQPGAWAPARFSALLIRELAGLGVRDFQLIGRFFAVRRCWLLGKTLPFDVISNDLWLLRTAHAEGRRFVHCPAAIVRYTAPSTLTDFKSQRIRAAAGCAQLAKWGLKDQAPPPTYGAFLAAFLRAAMNDPTGALSWLGIQVIIAALPWPGVRRPKDGLWEPLLSTKRA